MINLLLDTNAVSYLFKTSHPLHSVCSDLVSGDRLWISFMTRAELLVWPKTNLWGAQKTELLDRHLSLFTPLFPDESTCVVWADVVSASRSAGRPMGLGDAWIAATALQWKLPLVTADYRDFQHIGGLTLVPIA